MFFNSLAKFCYLLFASGGLGLVGLIGLVMVGWVWFGLVVVFWLGGQPPGSDGYGKTLWLRSS